MCVIILSLFPPFPGGLLLTSYGSGLPIRQFYEKNIISRSFSHHYLLKNFSSSLLATNNCSFSGFQSVHYGTLGPLEVHQHILIPCRLPNLLMAADVHQDVLGVLESPWSICMFLMCVWGIQWLSG